MSQELKWKIVSFLPDCANAKMASRKRERYKNKAKNLSTVYARIDESKIIIKNYK